jgi:hypothetical protein
VTVGISDVTREYALFEFLKEGNPLLDVGDSDEGKFEESHAKSDENRVIDHVAYEVSTRRGFDHEVTSNLRNQPDAETTPVVFSR